MRPGRAIGALVAGVVLAGLVACGGRQLDPAPLDTRNDACAWCRMTVSDPRTAAQVIAPGELPRFFDDLGCLRAWLAVNPRPARGAIYVADHRTGAWIEAERALVSECPGLETPMGSHLVAHADADSRRLDPAAAAGARTVELALAAPAGAAP